MDRIALPLVLLWICNPTSAFEVIWNVPSQKCPSLNPEKYGITSNEKNKFHGDKVAIFYETLGLFPFCNTLKMEDGTIKCDPVNGGVPQAVNMTAHLEKVKHDIEAAIPDPNFDGFGVIDYEAWRPLYDINWSSRNVYRIHSRELVRRNYGNVEGNTLQYLARFEFDNGAKRFLLATIQLAKRLRPKGKWGFWEYPLCDYEAGYVENECLKYYDVINHQLSYLIAASDVLYPAIYFYGYEPKERRLQHSYARLSQSQAFLDRYNHTKQVVPYIKIEYSPSDHSNGFYTKTDLCASIKYPMDSGVNSVIIWSSSYKIRQRCGQLEEFMANQLGPFVKEVKRKAEKCRAEHCNGNGRCRSEDLTPPPVCELAFQPARILCDCDADFSGEHCELGPTNSTLIPE